MRVRLQLQPLMLLCLAPALRAQSSRDLPILRWSVLASIPADTAAAALDRAWVPHEEALEPGPAPVSGMRWRAATADSAGRVDILALSGQPSLDRRVAYAVTWVTAPADRTVDLAVESDDDIAVWLDGVAVHRHVVTRAVWMDADTVTLRLAAGVNRIVFKIGNRDGGFGFGGRLLASSPGGLSGLAVSATRTGPAAGQAQASVTVGPVSVPGRAHLGAGGLMVDLTAPTTRWGDGAEPASLTLGGTRVAIPPAPAGRAAPLVIPIRWLELARLSRAGGGTATLAASPGVGSARRTPPLRDALLDQLSRPIPIDGWVIDSAAGRLRTSITVPDELAGLPLVLEAAEFSGATIAVNGAAKAPDTAGSVPLCAPCAAGSVFAIELNAHGATWWDAPSLRVSAAGWREIREGARWARRLAPRLAPELPSAAIGDSLLAAAADPAKTAWHATIGAWLDRLAPASGAIRRDTIDVVGNSHLDVVWLWELVDGIEVLRNTWRTATKLLAKYPRMHFAASSASYYALLERSDPALLQRIRDLVRSGRWDLVGGWWVEPDANMPSGESLIRQGLYGQRTLRRLFGRTATVAWTPDTFGYPWTLPQILLGSGLDGFVTQKLRWNDRNPWPAGQDAFWWEGPDGSRVLAYVPYGYDHDLDPDRLAAELDSTVAGGRMRRMLVLYGVGDHGGGPTIEMLERARSLGRIPTFPPLRETSPDSALARMGRDIAAGPVVNDELYLEYHRGAFTTNGAMKWWNRHMESLLGAAEAAAAVSPLPYPAVQLTRAWQATLFNQMHDILPGTSIRAVHRQAERDYATADSLASRMLERSVRGLMAGADTRPPRAGLRPYAVFNPSGRARAGDVRIAVRPGTASLGGFDRDGRPLPSTLVRDTLRIAVPPVPALGIAMVFVGPAADGAPAARANATPVLENDRLRAEIDPHTGEIARLYDKASGREILHRGNVLAMLEDRPGSWDAWNINHLNGRRTALDQRVAIGPHEGGPEPALTVRRAHDSVEVVQRYVLRDGPARLDIETTVAWHTRHELLKAGFVMPFHADSVRNEIAYGVMARPTVPRSSRDSARFEVPMHRWVDVSSGGQGVAIVNDSKYGYDVLGDTVRLSLLRSPLVPDAESDQRTHHFTVSVVPHDGDWRAPEVEDAADELNAPLRAVDLEEHGGGDLPAPPLAVAGDGGVRLGALKRAEDGGALVVRLVEAHGRASTAVVRFNAPMAVQPASMLEDATGKGSGPVRELEVRLRPWEIRTLLVRPAGP